MIATAVGCASETATPNHIRALRLRDARNGFRGRGNVRDVLQRLRRPLPAIKISLTLGVKMIVGQGIPSAERRVIIANALHVEVVRINLGRTQCCFRGIVWAAARHGTCRDSADQYQPNAFAPFQRLP